MSTAIPVPDDWRPFFSLDATWPGSGSDPVLFRTPGMLLLAPYVAFGSPGTGVEDRAVAVLRRVARGGDGRVCAHGWHPYEAEPANLSGPEILARQQCPCAVPGFARAALDYLGATVR
ncbi:hypothetical protein ACH4NC_19680 [Streptomyces sp. NPDC017201]|uniref:hypothetical protein n=1 Tax=Streptomyces sp. NPDC017201 TaxID=3364980 RepID=UPI0037A56B74